MQPKSIKALRRASMSVTCEEHKILCGFLSSKVSKVRLEIVNVHTVPPRFEKTKLWKKFAKNSTMTDSVPLHRPALK
jgi:transketolase C-terminal domain/subunit